MVSIVAIGLIFVACGCFNLDVCLFVWLVSTLIFSSLSFFGFAFLFVRVCLFFRRTRIWSCLLFFERRKIDGRKWMEVGYLRFETV